jgi:hypothetical protein
LAATKSGGTVSIFVDGVTMTTQAVPSDVAADQTLWTLGGDNRDNPDFNLIDVTLDDLRISGFARYEADFDPPQDYDGDTTSVILLLRLDEGEGELTSDPEAAIVDFSVQSPSWVPGNTQ